MPPDHVWKIRWSSGDGLQRVAVEEDPFGFDGLDQIDDLLGKGWENTKGLKINYYGCVETSINFNYHYCYPLVI